MLVVLFWFYERLVFCFAGIMSSKRKSGKSRVLTFILKIMERSITNQFIRQILIGRAFCATEQTSLSPLAQSIGEIVFVK